MSWRFTPKKLAKEIDESASVVVGAGVVSQMMSSRDKFWRATLSLVSLASRVRRLVTWRRHRGACLGASHRRVVSSRRRLTSRPQLSASFDKVMADYMERSMRFFSTYKVSTASAETMAVMVKLARETDESASDVFLGAEGQ